MISTQFHEIVLNLHMHTPYSDGAGSHREIAEAALEAGIDVVIVTDHNVRVRGVDGYHQNHTEKVLLLAGEEIHDQAREPQKNHLLVFGTGQELAPLADDPQKLLNGVKKAGGIAFIAHPIDPANPAIQQEDLSWENWDVEGYTGLELWNAMTEFKARVKNRLQAILLAFNPKRVAERPLPETLSLWDSLLARGKQVVAICGSDAHAFAGRLGPIRRTIFPYTFHFRCLNNHLLLPEPLSGDLEHDRQMVYGALRRGNVFIGYDLPASTRSFRFTAQGKNRMATMGDAIPVGSGVTLQVHLPLRAECRLLQDGKVLRTWKNRQHCTHITTEAGVYRVEVFIPFLGKRRGWIYSNPIYLQT